MKNIDISIENFADFIFDFDGVLTDNMVSTDQNGIESVRCNRSDGLAFLAFKKLNKNIIILSTETNNVVSFRGKKLDIPVIHGVENKIKQIELMASRNQIDLKKTMYIGNDINDFFAMQKCEFSACPADSHKRIIEISNFICKKNGGEGIAREILEDLFKIDLIDLLYTNSGP
jgi:3-deoxy-D-manno-octulosonate 8-phosphate phosphatase (KDO 8-P phosphatase)|tara:strand:+ start:118 stop:636 length:519 start_codon:yes stop_codon:yes gene_type:complete